MLLTARLGALLTREVAGPPLSPAELELVQTLRTRLTKLDLATKRAVEASGDNLDRQPHPRIVQGPAAGVRTIVSGGAPGLGKRA